MPVKSYYTSAIREFLTDSSERILGALTSAHQHSLEESQRWAWVNQIADLKSVLAPDIGGRIFFELYIPRMGKRADVVLLLDRAVLVVEFKVGAKEHSISALQQVEDYALDLKNFHEGSHSVAVIPVLISTGASEELATELVFGQDLVAHPLAMNTTSIARLCQTIVDRVDLPEIDPEHWVAKGYRPTPTIIEAAQVLYSSHTVSDIARSDADAINLQQTSQAVSNVIERARRKRQKAICFVTGVPGSGKTLAGLNIATQRSESHKDEHAVFLSGNGPLVAVLREALLRNKTARESVSKISAEREVRSFIQNIHHFRDHYLSNEEIPVEHVVVFDEAQRAWNSKQTSNFMQRKRGQIGFAMSEPEFLLSVMDRHPEWCTVVCLVGGGQEINTGEAGIAEWLEALDKAFSTWEVYFSPRITTLEYGASSEAARLVESPRFHGNESLHLAVSMRSFRAETLSEWVDHVVNNRREMAQVAYRRLQDRYPVVITRDLGQAREWLRNRGRGSERLGLVASSGAQRLRPDGINIKAELDPPNWFLNSSKDVRSSNYLEEVATEFDIQGLELDWAGVCWDIDFYRKDGAWAYQAFKGAKWQNTKDETKQSFLRNAYRVILTRARQGMVIVIPEVDGLDWTRPPHLYDGIYEYLLACGPTVPD